MSFTGKRSRHIAIVPARARSKSIINKNLMKIDGKKTLIERAINSALSAGIFDEIYLTTDIETATKDYEGHPKVVLRYRPSHLCDDTSLMRDVVKDVIESFKLRDDFWVWLRQPSSPFRARQHFQDIKEEIDTGRWMSVISIKEMVAEHPDRAYLKSKGRLRPLRHTNFKNKEDLMDLYIRNGCFYVCKVGDFMKSGNFFQEDCLGHLMEESESINIDGSLDLELAKIVASKKR